MHQVQLRDRRQRRRPVARVQQLASRRERLSGSEGEWCAREGLGGEIAEENRGLSVVLLMIGAFLATGERVVHILDASHVDEGHLTPGAVVRDDGTVVYPADGP
jgi:hypothetical protein